jgi:hypothetical protein
MREVAGYSIHASDGHIGHVEDFVVDDEEWVVRYIVVDTRNWLPGRKVLVSPEWVSRIDWRSNAVSIDHSRDEIRKSPHYDPNQPVNRQYEFAPTITTVAESIGCDNERISYRFPALVGCR